MTPVLTGVILTTASDRSHETALYDRVSCGRNRRVRISVFIGIHAGLLVGVLTLF